MKKKAKEFVVGCVMLVMFACLVSFFSYIETHYDREAQVININEDVIMAQDAGGNVWSFYGFGYDKGQKVILKMYTNHTDTNIYDDEVVNVHKSR